MNILVVNAGSSSLKYQLIDMPLGHVTCSGLVERIGFSDAIFTHKIQDQKHKEVLSISTHQDGLNKIANTLMDTHLGVIKDASEINAVGHRVVHGGSRFSKTTEINQEVKDDIRNLFYLAPLHNPANLTGIEICESIFPSAKQIAVFDTAFHQTIPQVAYQYAIPKEFLTQSKIRVYGFHGTSHKYVSEKAIEHLNKTESNIITIHLGNGCSIAAIKGGKCIDTSLGFGPMNGLVMGTRSGDIDQSVIFYMHNSLGMSMKKINSVLQKESGLKGLTGFSDLREIERAASIGNQDCLTALKLTAYRIKKYIGSYIAALNGLDAIVFTAGIGENSSTMRQLVCEDLDSLGIALDANRNDVRSDDIREIQKEGNSVKVLVIPTNEEIEIARQAYALLNG
jgi:acetate kinase